MSAVGPPEAPAGRRADIAARVASVRGRIQTACQGAGRDPGEITLVAVTKRFPASDVRVLHDLGVTDVGENTDQEAAAKAARCVGLEPPVTWHFVGRLQTNKCASVVTYAHVVHSVDRVRLARALGSRARRAGRKVTCFVQVSLDADPDRGGAPLAELAAVAEAVVAEQSLLLAGVMAVAPLGVPAAEAFERLPRAAEAVRGVAPRALAVSAGMSHDFEEAIAVGATHLRVGTALLGGRPAFVR